MKKITLLVVLLISTISTAQEKEEKYPQDIDKKAEIKINALSLIALASFDVSYERLLNKDSSFGVSLFYNFGDINDDIYFPKTFSLTPYYRWFFSETRFARGFFIEGFGMLNTYEEEIYSYSSSYSTEKETNFALGISAGGKFITRSGFVAEIYLGVGRNLLSNNNDNFIDNTIISRGGITIGYRF